MEAGIKEGMEAGIQEGIKKGILRCIEAYQECAVPREDTLFRLMEKFSLDHQTAEAYIEKYWK